MKRLIALGLLVIAMVSVQIGGVVLSANSIMDAPAIAIIDDDGGGI